MEKAIVERYNERILAEARRRFGYSGAHIEKLGGFESFLFSIERGDQAYILRITHSIRRSEAMILGEIDWINYLADRGLGVARAVPSLSGELVELIADEQGGQFLAAAFVKAEGGPAWHMDWWNDILFERYGRLIGRMHALSKDYEPAHPAWRRGEWDDPHNVDVLAWVPDDQPLVKERGAALLAYLRSLPKDGQSYGLIHQDAHGGNFFVDGNGRITLFDFDDCAYGWFAYDIAMVLFYAVTNHADPQGFMAQFWPHFWRGYCQENDLDPVWLSELPAFFKLREIDLYAVINRSFDVSDLKDTWVARFMTGRRERIEQNIPYLVFDFTKKIQR